MPYITHFSTRPAADRRRLAESYAEFLGAAAFPVRGKTPLTAVWNPYLDQSNCYGSPSEWAQATGYALAPVRDSLLVIIDVDNSLTSAELLALCPALRETFATQRGPHHSHLYCRLADSGLRGAYLTRKEGTHELASLRGIGAYVVGPESDHPDGDQYLPNNKPVITLSLFEQTALLAWFAPPLVQPPSLSARLDGGHAVRLTRSQYATERDRQAIVQVAHQHGYRPSGDWLNGPCIHPEKHKHGDLHPSFGVNTVTGVGHCFVCGNYAPQEVAAAFKLRPAFSPYPTPASRPYAFVTERPRPSLPPIIAGAHDPSGQVVQVELNITNALIRQGNHAAARLHDLLFDDSGRHQHQHTYRMADLVALGRQHRLSRSQVDKSVRSLCQLGLLRKRAKGLYSRVAVSKVREILGLGNEYALIELPRAAFCGSVADYTAVVLFEIEQLLPGQPAAATIAKAAGISPSSLYHHEARAGIVREIDVRLVNLVSSTVHFAKVSDSGGQPVATVNGPNIPYQAAALAYQTRGQAYGFQQRPSKRFFSPQLAKGQI